MASTTTTGDILNGPLSSNPHVKPTDQSTEMGTETNTEDFPGPSPGVQDISSFPRIYTGEAKDIDPAKIDKINIGSDLTSENGKEKEDALNSVDLPISLRDAVEETERIHLKEGGKGKDIEAETPSNEDEDRGRERSDEWDAAKTPPSRFQQPKGSVYATPNSRDSHVEKNQDRDRAYHEKIKEGSMKVKSREEKKKQEKREQQHSKEKEEDKETNEKEGRRSSWLGRMMGLNLGIGKEKKDVKGADVKE